MNAAKIRNSKFEIRNPKQIQMIKKINDRNKNHPPLPLNAPERTAFVSNFELLNFEFVSNFVLRASDFIFTRWALRKYTDEQLVEVTERLKQQRKERKKEKEFLLCANCSFVITSLDYKMEIDGLYRHTFKNPAGVVYTIGCFSKAVGCFNFGDPTEQYTWFPGYAWCYANCLNCFLHLGWFYQSGERHFYGLILDHLTASPAARGAY